MSFSKAKLQRFSDDKPCAPPPGSYNPSTVDKTVGPIINKTERFADNKQMIHASSTESVNSLQSEKGTSCTGTFSTFKTPRIPNTFRPISQTDVKGKYAFSHQKAVSTDFINKKGSHENYKINSLTYSLNMMQEELSMEKSRNQELLDELLHLKENTTSENDFSEWLVDVISEKDKLVDLLEEKCHTLQSFTKDYMESYQEYVRSIYRALETHYEISSKTDADLTRLVEGYEKLVAQHEQDLEMMFVFLTDFLHKQNNVAFEGALSGSSTEQCNNLIAILKETERGRRRYEIIVQEMQKVISVLSARVHESDKEVEKMYEVVAALTEEKEKLKNDIHSKEDEILTMRNIIESMNKKFANEVLETETGLLNLVDEFKDQAVTEKQNYEQALQQKDSVIADLITSKNEMELQLQESLDNIEVLKCKEEMLLKRLDHIQSDLHEKCSIFENALQQCHQRLVQWEALTEQMQAAQVEPSDICIGESGENTGVKELTTEPLELAKKLVIDFVTTNQLLPVEQVNKLASVENFTEYTNILEDILLSTFNECTTDKASFIHLFGAVLNTFSKLGYENSTLKNDVSRLRNDFIEKCDECAQATRLLQLSEKHIDVSEQKAIELESCQDKWERQITQQQQQIDSLQNEKIDLQQHLSDAKSRVEQREHDISMLSKEISRLQEGLEKQDLNGGIDLTSKLQSTIKDEQTKLKALEMQNAKLVQLIGPYRQVLEKYEAESKTCATKNASSINTTQKKYLKSLNQQNQELKMKNGISSSQLKKKNEIQNRKLVPKAGKENKVMTTTNNKDITDVRRAVVAEVPVNATYIVTSPQVNRI